MRIALFAVSPDTSPGPTKVTSRKARKAWVRKTRLKNALLIPRPFIASPTHGVVDRSSSALALWLAYTTPQASSGGIKQSAKKVTRSLDSNTDRNAYRDKM